MILFCYGEFLKKEIIANPALSEGDNNPTAPTPQPVEDF